MSNSTTAEVGSPLRDARMIGSMQGSDDDGVLDPSLDKSLNIGTDDAGVEGDDDASELDVGQFIRPVRSLGADNGEPEIELDIGSWIHEPECESEADDVDGPVADPSLLAIDSESAIDTSEIAEDELESTIE